ncbi:hypothetical protein OROMI_002341 [Orobanche minor]
MDSHEKVNSGMFAVGRSSFSQTCSLLSRYLKEKGSFGELSLGLTPYLSESRETVNISPMIGKSGRNSGPGKLEIDVDVLPRLVNGGDETLHKSDCVCCSCKELQKEMGQMTIFYAGQVVVFDDFPADRAKEIMMLARMSSAEHPAFAQPHTAESAAGSPNVVVPAFGIIQEGARRILQSTPASDLPIARKNSLARFLEKRKDRITGNAPYQISKPAAAVAASPKPVKTEPWLGLAPRLPLQRH